MVRRRRLRRTSTQHPKVFDQPSQSYFATTSLPLLRSIDQQRLVEDDETGSNAPDDLERHRKQHLGQLERESISQRLINTNYRSKGWAWHHLQRTAHQASHTTGRTLRWTQGCGTSTDRWESAGRETNKIDRQYGRVSYITHWINWWNNRTPVLAYLRAKRERILDREQIAEYTLGNKFALWFSCHLFPSLWALFSMLIFAPETLFQVLFCRFGFIGLGYVICWCFLGSRPNFVSIIYRTSLTKLPASVQYLWSTLLSILKVASIHQSLIDIIEYLTISALILK
jgi:hypothetical protein